MIKTDTILDYTKERGVKPLGWRRVVTGVRNKGCVVTHLRSSQVVNVVSGSTSLPGTETFYKCKFPLQKGKLVLYF